MDWYYAEAGERIGPIPEPEFRALCAAGKLTPFTLAWRAGMTGWEPIGQLNEWVSAPTAPEQPVCSECHRPFAPEDLLSFERARVCAGCKDLFFQRLREQGVVAAGPARRYGGFWIRALARLIDGLILGAVYVVLLLAWEVAMRRTIVDPTRASSQDLVAMWAAFGTIYLISLATSLTYEAWFLARRAGTPGKLALGLRVVRSDGERLTTGRSIGRTFGYLLSSMMPLCIAFIIAGVDDEKRALHDRLCDTRVVYRT